MEIGDFWAETFILIAHGIVNIQGQVFLVQIRYPPKGSPCLDNDDRQKVVCLNSTPFIPFKYPLSTLQVWLTLEGQSGIISDPSADVDGW